MNIAVIAPTKFDFQDLACVELGLRWPAEGAPSLRAEPENGEDAELIWDEGGKRRLCEVQVKGRSTAEINMATLAEYLAHFPDRQAHGCLLERLIGNPDQVVLFVASERCRDEVVEYRVPTNWTGARRTVGPHRRAGKGLADALQYLSEWPERARTKIPTQLEADRAIKLAELSRTSADQLAEALSRVFIHEEETPATIVVRLQQKLFDHGVPSDRLADGISRLKQVVASDRTARRDVFSSLRKVLAEFAPEQQAPPKYLLRGNERDFAAVLAREKAILLSGPPRVGKSWLALQLAGGLQRQGFEIARSSHIDQADRFLNDPVRKPRAYVLEDPLGDRQSVADSTKRVSDLRRLLTSLPLDRRLIVSQSDAPILQTFRQKSLSDCSIGQFAWRILGPLSAEQAEILWRRDAAEALVAPEEIERVAAIVRLRHDFRDAGALSYLATTYDRLRQGATTSEIVAQARGDAVDFAQMLADESAEAGDVLRGVAVSTEATTGVSETELAFVLSGGTERPSLDQSDGIVVFGLQEATVAPFYAATPSLGQASKDATVTLRRRRVLESQSSELSFVHPYLRAGAQAIFRPDIEEDVVTAVAFTERALAAVDPNVSLAAARNLDWIATALATHNSGLARALTLAKTGLRSRYPATRDACFGFLTSRATDLPSDELKELRRWVSAVDVDLDDIEEVDGALMISKTAALFRQRSVPLASVKPYVDAIEAGQPIDLDPALAYAILISFQQNGTGLTPKLMERLLSMDAAVLRATASADWLKVSHAGDEDIIRRIMNDATPAVSNAVLDVLARTWERLPEERREVSLAILSAHAVEPGSAITLMERLSKFNRVEYFGETPPWQVFTRLAPIAFEHAPDVVFRNGRIVSAIEDAIRAGEGERLIPLLDVWSKQLARRITTRLPDEFELSVPDSMLDVGQPAWRWPLISDILSVKNTGARLRIIATLISRWNELSDDEQQAIIRLILQEDTDADWLRAAALTREDVPRDVALALTGHGDLLELSPPELLAVLGEPLYRACLHVYVGMPQPLWWLGSHHSRATLWTEAVRWSAAATERPCFHHALEDQLSFAEDNEWLADLVDGYRVDELPEVFSVFLRRKIEDNGNWRTLAWNRLLDRGVQAGLVDEWAAQISDAAPVFLDHLRDVRHWLGKGPHEDRLIEKLHNDVRVYRITKDIADLIGEIRGIDTDTIEGLSFERGSKGPSPKEMVSDLIELLHRALEQMPPRLFGTLDYLADVLKDLDAGASPIDDWVAEQRRQILDERREPHHAEPGTDDRSELVGWAGPR